MQQEANTALLVMDMQEKMLSSFPSSAPLIDNVGKAIAHAREKNIPVIYVRICFRPGAPEISPNNKPFSAFTANYELTEDFMNQWKEIHPSLAPEKGEIIVDKRRISAFSGSDLDVVLRAKNIQTLVLTGIATSGVVLSTIREASDKDFSIIVLEDGCADREADTHHFLMEKIFPRQAEVMRVEEWIK